MSEDGIEVEGIHGEQPGQKPLKQRKPRKASNYALQQYMIIPGQDGAQQKAWVEVKDGFTGPKLALAYAKKENLEGVFRVSRTVTPSFAYTLTHPKPILTIEKVKIR